MSDTPSEPVNVYALIPRPRHSTRRPGQFVLGPATALVARPGAAGAADTLRSYLSPSTGLPLPTGVDTGEGLVVGAITLELDAGLANLGSEGYRLTVGETGIRLQAAGAAGLFYATQTLRQMLAPEIYRSAGVGRRAWEIACGEVEDRPRFTWRGGMLDVGRYYLPQTFLLRFVDLLAMHKYNVLHLHLTDDQGWRFASERYPRLVEVGSWRSETMKGDRGRAGGDGTPHGGFYSRDDLRELVDYAARRFVTVVPEIDLPGHTRAAIAAYPWLGNTGEQLEVKSGWGIDSHVLNMEERTIQFCRDVLGEVAEVFPSPFIHVGGDECPRTEWEQSDAARARAVELGLSGGVAGLQSWFTAQMGTWLAGSHRRLIGWDEILEGQPAPDAAVMAWQSEKVGIAAARAGHDVVMSPQEWCYFNYYESDQRHEPLAHPSGCITLERAYSYEPVPAALSDEEAERVLGSQFAIWTEYAPDPATVEYLAFPRVCAHSEAAWSSGPKDWSDFRARVAHHLRRLEALGVNFRPLQGPHPWQEGGTGARQRPHPGPSAR